MRIYSNYFAKEYDLTRKRNISALIVHIWYVNKQRRSTNQLSNVKAQKSKAKSLEFQSELSQTPEYKKRLLQRDFHHWKLNLINNMDHMHISGTEP